LETSHLVRVIAGVLGGRRLQAPRGMATRPTSDRVREALFMALEPIGALRVLDLFAGSGALGIEALSRGAVHADFVEPNRHARAALEQNLDTLELRARSTIWPFQLPRGLARLSGVVERADLVLLDPPYGGAEARETLTALAQMSLVSEVRVVLEHHARDEVPVRCFSLERVRERHYGETRVSTYRRSDLPDRPGIIEESV
jgi:16S rRNA (guanine966-N2)-methyltransferase